MTQAKTYGERKLALIGWQIVSFSGDENPEGMASFEVYTEKFVLDWMANLPATEKSRWRLVPIFGGDIEEPTIMEDD